MAKGLAELDATTRACAEVREAFYALGDQRSRLNETKAECLSQIANISRTIAEQEALALVGREAVDLEDLRGKLATLQQQRAALEQSASVGIPAAIEKLRGELEACHDQLSTLLRDLTADLRKTAITKYDSALQDLRDALTIFSALDGRFFSPSAIKLPDIDHRHNAFAGTQPATSTSEAIRSIKPHLDERDRSLRTLLR